MLAPCLSSSTTGWDPVKEAQLLGMRPVNASNPAEGFFLWALFEVRAAHRRGSRAVGVLGRHSSPSPP